MQVLHPRCAGLVVHDKTVVACVRVSVEDATRIDVHTFDTKTPGLLALAGWLGQHCCTHVAVQAAGDDWKAIWQTLTRGHLTLILVNTDDMRNVLGRKADVADATWLAEVMARGLIGTAFLHEPANQSLPALLRTRKRLVREQAGHARQLKMALDDASVNLASVLNNVLGVSGRAVVHALIDGRSDPNHLLTLIDRGVKASREKLYAALQGHITAHHRFLLRRHIYQIEALDAAIAEIDREVHRRLDPFRKGTRQAAAGLESGESTSRRVGARMMHDWHLHQIHAPFQSAGRHSAV